LGYFTGKISGHGLTAMIVGVVIKLVDSTSIKVWYW
jgi:hypothetical protein